MNAPSLQHIAHDDNAYSSVWGVPDLVAAVACGEVGMRYQPQVDALTGALIGFESLARWDSPRFGAVAPDRFVEVLEQANRMDVLWQAILSTTARDMPIFRAAFGQRFHLALNVSATQLACDDFARDFERWLCLQMIDSAQIHVEITESALLSAGPATRRNLDALVGLGVQLWLDDFGTGYSGLRHLRELPITGLKIDKSFVDEIESNIDDFRIVSAITAMACSLGLKVVAEGVETETQMQILSQLGCTTLQGFLIGRPQSLDSLKLAWSRGA